jgi:hypothetical protein
LFSAVDRYQLLPKDEDFVFDFANSNTPFANSNTPFANGKSFPALVGSGMSFSTGQLPGMFPTSLEYLALSHVNSM